MGSQSSDDKKLPSILSHVTDSYPHPEKLKIRDPERVEGILKALLEKGPSRLQLITDFDYTLTKFKSEDGVRADTCHGIIDHSPLTTEDFKLKVNKLWEKYYPIEIDHGMTIEEKIPYMVEWYIKSHNVLIDYKFRKETLKEMVARSRAYLRDKVPEILASLHDANVPVLIFSAGIGDVLQEVLIRDKVFYPNIKVVSNYMEFDNDGQVVKFKSPLIHMFNKNEKTVEHSSYFKEISHRHNAIVLGDSVGDVNMDHGMDSDAVLKIGFLNDKIQERFEEFYTKFDIVLLDDQSFDIVGIILSHILK